MVRRHSPPPTRFGVPGSVQTKSITPTVAPKTAPPPTRFGPASVQQKPLATAPGAAAAIRAPAPPPTRFGPSGTVQAKPVRFLPHHNNQIAQKASALGGGGGDKQPPPVLRTSAKAVAVKKKPMSASLNCLGYALTLLAKSGDRELPKGLQWATQSVRIMQWVQAIIWNGESDILDFGNGIGLKFTFTDEVELAPENSIIVAVYEFDEMDLAKLESRDQEEYLNAYREVEQDDAHYFFKGVGGALTGVPHQGAGRAFPVRINESGDVFQTTADTLRRVQEIKGYLTLC